MLTPDSFIHEPKDPTNTLQCQNCHLPFTPSRSWQRYGNRFCAQAFWHKTYALAAETLRAQGSTPSA